MAKQQVAFMYETNAAFSLSVLSLLMTMLLLGGIWLYWLTAEPKSGTRDPDDVAINTLLPDEHRLSRARCACARLANGPCRVVT